MNQSILATRKAEAIETISQLLSVDFTGLPRALDTEHRDLFRLERIAETLKNKPAAADGFTLDDILAIDGLSKTSIKAIESALGE